MRAVFAIGAGSAAAERLLGVARDLDERGHAVALALDPARGAPGMRVHPWSGRTWLAALPLARIVAREDAELLVAGDPSALALARWAVRLARGAAATGLEAGDADGAETELESARAVARSMGRAVFLDRDGTLLPETGALGRPDAVRLLPGVAAALRALAAARYELVVVTNQAAVGRGELRLEDVRLVHAELRRKLRAEGVELAGIFVCPHRPEDGCDCRKPAPGLLTRAAWALRLALDESWLIGDSTRDVEAARAAGVEPILLDAGWAGNDPAAPPAGAGTPRRRTWKDAVTLVTRGRR